MGQLLSSEDVYRQLVEEPDEAISILRVFERAEARLEYMPIEVSASRGDRAAGR